jgi:hypothetical protein
VHGQELVTHSGGCHCGAVRFEVRAPAHIEVADCNCSICRKSGYLHLIVPAALFSLLCGSATLTTYTFNTGIAKHRFCSVCGIKSFYTPRSHPDGISVNATCIDSPTVESMTIVPFDGIHWEKGRAAWRDLPSHSNPT